MTQYGCVTLRTALFAGVSWFVFSSAAFAQTAVNLPGQSLSQSLNDIARQTGENILFEPGAVVGVRAQAVSGKMTAREAVERVIAHSNLEAVPDDAGSLIIRKKEKLVQISDAGGQASAQQSAPATAQATRSEDGIAEIVVTAQRREEKAQDVPIAVAAFSSDQMRKMGLSSSNDLPSIVPGLTNSPTPIRTYFYLRGIGTNSLSSSPSVQTYIDGVYQPFNPAAADFSGVERIEIAKGPQGTLFGRNATAGVIQITTANPFKWQGVDAQVGYANYNTLSGKIYGSAKLADNVAASLSAFYNEQKDGWGIDRVNGKEAFKSRRYGARGKLVVEFDDSFTGTLVGDYSYSWGQIGAVIPQVGTSLFNPAAGRTFTLPGRFDFTADFWPFGRNKEGGGALTLDKRFGDLKLLSISSYRQSSERLAVDSDGTGAPFLNITVGNRQRSFTQELQLSGDHESFNWVSGVFYYHIDKKPVLGFAGIFPSLPSPFGTPFGTPYVVYSTPHMNAYAGYAQGTLKVLPKTNLTLGVRYTTENHHIEGYTTGSPTLSPASAGTEQKTFSKPTFRASLDHKLTSDVMVYASYNRGFNAGFFNQASAVGFTTARNPAVDPESIDAYEIGVKSQWLDQRLQVNVAGFLYDYANLQQQIYKFGNLFTINAAAARIKGVDLDIVTRPVRDLTLSLSTNYLDTSYKSYPLAPLAVVSANGDLTYVGARDAKGNQLVLAPKYGVQATVSYRLETAVGAFDTSGNLNYQSRMFADPQNQFPVPSRTLLSITEQWTSNDERTSITAWVKNITNKAYDVSVTVQEHSGLIGYPGAPRTYGVTVGHRF